MNTRTLATTAVALAAAHATSPHAAAQTSAGLYWTVNGVERQDFTVANNRTYRIELWADWFPAQVGLAGATFDLFATEGTEHFGPRISNLQRNPTLATLTAPPVLADLDGDGTNETVQGVDVVQLPPNFAAGFAQESPLQLIGFDWDSGQDGELAMTLEAGVAPNSDTEAFFSVYTDNLGSSEDYTDAFDPQTLSLTIPGPAPLIGIVATGLAANARRRRQDNAPVHRRGVPARR